MPLLGVLLLFLMIPLIELFVLIEVGRVIGAGPTVLLVLVTGILGAALTRSQGMKILRAIRWEMNQGRVPTEELLHGLLVLIGGLFLLTPGLLTDVSGLFLVLPPTRKLLIAWIRRMFERWINTGSLWVFYRR